MVGTASIVAIIQNTSFVALKQSLVALCLVIGVPPIIQNFVFCLITSGGAVLSLDLTQTYYICFLFWDFFFWKICKKYCRAPRNVWGECLCFLPSKMTLYASFYGRETNLAFTSSTKKQGRPLGRPVPQVSPTAAPSSKRMGLSILD